MSLLLTPETSDSTSEPVKLYLNKPQTIAYYVDAKDERHVWGRGTGKSEGRLAHRALGAMQAMPRSAGVNVAESYMQLLDRTLPPMLKRWQDMGMRRDVDFWVRKFPPRNIGLEFPYLTPETPEHSIFVRVNKTQLSLMRLVSQDRPGTSNGMSVDWILGDEAKFLIKDRLDSELMPTNRGNERYFKHSHLHHSTCFTTDMPESPGGKWILDSEEHNDPDAVALIMAIQGELFKLQVNARQRGHYTKKELALVESLNAELTRIRKSLMFYSEASTLDNIDVLGVDFIKQMKRDLPDFKFRTSILNQRPGKGENTFYPGLMDRHFYSAIEYSFVDGQSEKAYGKGRLMDCRKDADLDRSLPLRAAMDVGGSINVIVGGQYANGELQIQNAMYVLPPKRIPHLADEWARYYKHYPKKELILYYDSTHYAANPVSDKNPLDAFCDRLEEDHGWRVTRYNIGVTPSYRNRFLLWDMHLAKNTKFNAMNVMFNRGNTVDLRTAMQDTEFTWAGKTGFEKDKRMERDKKANQAHAPHFTDAVDTLLVGVIKQTGYARKLGSSLILL